MKQNGQRAMETMKREDDIVPRYSRFDRKQRHGSTSYQGSEPATEDGPPYSPGANGDSAALSSRPKFLSRRNGFFLLLLCICGLVGGAYFARQAQSALPALTDASLRGTWQLQSINNDPIGPNVDSTVISQYILFDSGKLHGETVLRGDSPASSTALPFPDETVTRVIASPDSQEVTVTWDGSYTWLDERRLQFQIGKAKYLVAAHLDPVAHRLQLDQDAILTYRGAARYQAAFAVNPPHTR